MQTMQKDARFEQLVNAYSSWLYRYAYWFTSDRSAAEDLVQETFLRAWRFLDALQDEGSARSWLMTILRRENARRYKRKRLSMAEAELDAIPSEAVDFDPRPETLALRHAMGQLPPKYREPLVLQALQGFSLDDIAAVIELRRNTVATRLHRARQKLRATLTADQKDVS